MTKIKATDAGPMAGKSKRKVASTAATEKALSATNHSTLDPAKLATIVHQSLLASSPKLDKVGARLEKALKAIMDGGDASNLSALAKQVDEFNAKGTPAVMKSTSRGGGLQLTDADSKQIEDEAKARKAGTIGHCKSTQDGNYLAVGKVGGDSFVIPKTLVTKEFNAISAVGMAYEPAKKLADELIAARPAAKLANGIDAHNSPHSAAAVASGRSKASKASKPAPKADPKKEARKADKAEKAAPKGDDKRAITIVKKDFAFGREGSARRASWDKALKAKTVQAYIAGGGAAKYLPRWVSAGAIKLG